MLYPSELQPPSSSYHALFCSNASRSSNNFSTLLFTVTSNSSRSSRALILQKRAEPRASRPDIAPMVTRVVRVKHYPLQVCAECAFITTLIFGGGIYSVVVLGGGCCKC